MSVRWSSFSRLLDKLFEGPLSTNYLVGAVVAMLAGGYLTFSPTLLPITIKALVMMATLLAIARLFSPPLLRRAWLGLMALLSLLPLLDLLGWVLGW